MPTSFRRVFLLLLTVLAATISTSGRAQTPDYQEEAEQLFAAMNVEERVGQLFLVPIRGPTVERSSDIVDLVLNYHVGGVVLLAEYDNIAGGNAAPTSLIELTSGLQRLAIMGEIPQLTESEGPIAELATLEVIPTPVSQTTAQELPLFIATAHDGDGPPHTEIRDGLTELPNGMAIGATWNEDNSRLVGQIAGGELASIGVNMLLGPSLDVLEDPIAYRQNDLGTLSFGGDPFWVGVMGSSYIEGVHQGSDNRIAVIAKHFPGFGSSDRPINEEVGTVRKSLEQLKQIELAPFFTVTASPPGSELGTVDGLLSAHIRYQGFQGNIRAATAPVSFDPQALNTLMELAEFSSWRQAGGLIVSDALGVRAVQRFYDDTGQEFPHRLVAKDALLAGNDLLNVTGFGLGQASYDTQLANIKDSILWFREKYVTDQTFQQRVDAAVTKIIALKLRLYKGDLNLENVLANGAISAQPPDRGQASLFDMSQEAITLLAPTTAEIIERLPPGPGEDVVIFTDLRFARQCSTCPLEPWIDNLAIQERMLTLYGPSGSAQLSQNQLTSFTFTDLAALLNRPAQSDAATQQTTETPNPDSDSGDQATTPTPSPTPSPADRVELALNRAEWLIFAMLEPDDDYPGSNALNRFLADRPDIVRNADIVVIAFNAPYFLDTTEISQLTAYIGAYGKGDLFVDAAVRVLFGESPLVGSPPVDIDGIAYDLFAVTQPDPTQVIELFVVDNDEPRSPPRQEPLEVVPGATLRLQTGVILDHNRNPVPDGTPVQFIQQDRIQGFVNVIAERPTQGGVANLDYLLDNRSGNFRITVASGSARASEEIDIVIGENAIVSVNTPTPAPTSTATPTETPTETPTATAQPSPTATRRPAATATAAPERTLGGPRAARLLAELPVLVAALTGMAIAGVVAYSAAERKHSPLEQKVRQILWSQVGALTAYNYYALELPGYSWLASYEPWSALLAAAAGGLLGLSISNWVRRRLPGDAS